MTNPQRILIIGATSAIAEHTAREFAARSATLMLAGRDVARLADIAADLRLRGAASVSVHALDLADHSAHEALLNASWQQLGSVDGVLIAHGTLSDEERCRREPAYLVAELNLNAVATILLISQLAARFETQGQGRLAVISSVAGERGRASNYAYGSAKAAVTAYLSGLRQRLHGTGISVLTIKPGLVDTPMTRAFRKGALWAQPANVGKAIYGAMQSQRAVLYTPGIWALIAAVVRALPQALFERVGPR